MDKSAIEKIQEERAIVNANTAISVHALQDKVLALPNHFTLHDLEKFDSNRSRLRGQLETRSVETFAAYAKNNVLPGAATFINADAMTAQLIINLGDDDSPGHCDHTAKIYLTASYGEDEEGNRQQVTIVKALHAVRKITIEEKVTNENETRNFGASSSSMESIDVKSLDMPPDYLYFTTEPYFGLKSRTFELRLSIIKDRAPALVLRIVRIEEHKEEMAKEFQEIIEQSAKDIDPKIVTYVGVFKP